MANISVVQRMVQIVARGVLTKSALLAWGILALFGLVVAAITEPQTRQHIRLQELYQQAIFPAILEQRTQRNEIQVYTGDEHDQGRILDTQLLCTDKYYYVHVLATYSSFQDTVDYYVSRFEPLGWDVTHTDGGEAMTATVDRHTAVHIQSISLAQYREIVPDGGVVERPNFYVIYLCSR